VEITRHLLTDWAPLHSRPAAGLTRKEIAARLLELRAKGNVTANRARASLRTCYRWGIRQGLVEANPVDGTEQTREPRRERFLSLEELRAIWQAAGDGDHGDIVRLLILTGQRREEVGGMLWREVDLAAGLWHLPPARTKNGQAHWVPLPAQAVAILEARRGASARDNVFGNGGGAFSGWSRAKRRLDGRCGVAGWRLHDLRRSFVTHLAETGIAFPHVIEALVNHQSGHKASVAGIYNRAEYRAGRRAAVQRWADFVLGEVPA
jgi:integrase